MSLSACWKTGQNPCKNTNGENCIAQVVCWHFVRLCGSAGVGGEVSDEKKQSKHIHIRTAFSTTRIHKENKQVLPYQPTLLKTLANTIYFMCLFQHGKQNRTHARTNMVKIAWRKLFAGILCGCVVLLVCCEVSDGKKPSKPIHILTALFTTRVHKENKQILPYQPTSGKLWPT